MSKILTADECKERTLLRRNLKSHFETVLAFDKAISKLELEMQCEGVLAKHSLSRLRQLDAPDSIESFLNTFTKKPDDVRKVKSLLRIPCRNMASTPTSLEDVR